VKEIGINGKLKRDTELYKLFQNNGYEVYAETPANTIFIDTMDYKTLNYNTLL